MRRPAPSGVPSGAWAAARLASLAATARLGSAGRHPGRQTVVSSTPAETACLQAVDYFLWALQRFYERKEDRFLELIWPQVGEVHDLDIMIDRRQGAFFTRDRPLTSAIWGEGEQEPGI